MNFQLAMIFGILAVVSLIIGLILGVMAPKSKRNLVKFHKGIALVTLALVVLHAIAVLVL